MNKKTFNFSQDELRRLYYDSELTLIEIGKIYGCCGATIRNYFIKFKIKRREAAHVKQTEKAKQKLSQLATGRKHSSATKKKFRKILLGKFGSKARNWQGGRTGDGHGYILIKKHGHPRANKKGYVKEQILVMEKVIGRFLTKNEIVHHMNRIKDDNRPKNLKLFANNSEHMRYHNLYDPINK